MTVIGRPVLCGSVLAVPVGAETVAWVESTESLHLLDPVASSILRLCDGTRTCEDISATLATTYGAAPDRVRDDVDVLVRTLLAQEVLTTPTA